MWKGCLIAVTGFKEQNAPNYEIGVMREEVGVIKSQHYSPRSANCGWNRSAIKPRSQETENNYLDLLSYIIQAQKHIRLRSGHSCGAARRRMRTADFTFWHLQYKNINVQVNCMQEEADMRLPCHWDWSVIPATAVSATLDNSQAWVAFGHGAKPCYIPCHFIAFKQGTESSWALLSGHALLRATQGHSSTI